MASSREQGANRCKPSFTRGGGPASAVQNDMAVFVAPEQAMILEDRLLSTHAFRHAKSARSRDFLGRLLERGLTTAKS